MKSKEKLWEICMDIYRQQYKEAEPSADFNKLMKEGKTIKQNWFMNYYLDKKRQQEIIDDCCKKNKLDTWDEQMINQTIWLGSSPTSERLKDE